MNISNQSMRFGLHAYAQFTGTGTPESGVTTGIADLYKTVPSSTVVAVGRAVMAGGPFGVDVQLNAKTFVATGGWTPGSPQKVEVVISGTASDFGNFDVTVSDSTAAVGSFSVFGILTDDTATDVAGKVVAAAKNDSVFSALFDAESFASGGFIVNAVRFSRKADVTFDLGKGQTAYVYKLTSDYDSLTVDFSADFTTIGLAAEESEDFPSADTEGVMVYDLDGRDIEGNLLGDLSSWYGYLIQGEGDAVTVGYAAPADNMPIEANFPDTVYSSLTQHYLPAGFSVMSTPMPIFSLPEYGAAMWTIAILAS